MNRGLPWEMPKPRGAFTDPEALDLLYQYRKNPGALTCPTCGPETMEVLAFIEPEISAEGLATVRQPEGQYAVALFCHTCARAIGVLPSAVFG